MKKPNGVQADIKKVTAKSQARELSPMAAIALCDIYDRLEKKPFREAVDDFSALSELFAGNNAPEVRAINKMVRAELTLNSIRAKVRAI